MKKLYFFLGFLAYFFLGNLSAQDSLNMEVLYNYDAPGHTYNDCWGYVDDAGNEYAIVGTKTKIYFYDITDPANVTLVDEFSNNNPSGLSMTSTTWRDFKTYGTKAYACADQSNNTEGLLVFDLSDLPNSVTFESQTTDFFKRAHNIFIDTLSGRLYVVGGRLNNNTSVNVIVIDLTTDPISLMANASIAGGYVHDIYVRNDTAYCSSGYDGLIVVDFDDPDNPDYLGSIDTEEYNHSSWLSDDGNYAFYAEEVPIGRPLGVVDLSDLGNMDIETTFKEPLLAPEHTNNRPHNPYVRDDLLIVSYYHDGVQIFDISDPLNPTLEGYYDTYPSNTNYTSYYGCWGVYPYFPSGNIIATDMSNGFFVLEYTEAPLPVELIHFSARLKNDHVKLEWATASEQNSKHFEIQKSANGVDFETIARVAAAGDSDTKIDYLAYDEKPFSGDNYYRLKQVDFDGKFEYSDIEVVRFSTSPIDIFPTLVKANEPLKIVFSENMQDLEIQVFSIHGQLLQTNSLSAENGLQQELRLNDLNNGTFIIRAFNGNHQVSKRIVLVR
jgi:choice-of-anchor B domain-containing protein